jgi:hypothetical protein
LATMLLALGNFLLPFVHMGWGWGHEIGETLSHVLGFICVATEDGIMWIFGLWYVLLLLLLFTLLLGCFFSSLDTYPICSPPGLLLSLCTETWICPMRCHAMTVRS